jgi:hypothetical protein
MGRIFAYWAFVYFGQFFGKFTDTYSPNFWATFYGKRNVLILSKNGLGYILGDK